MARIDRKGGRELLRGAAPGLPMSIARVSSEAASFAVAVPDVHVADLRDRLARTRWPDRETVDDWSQTHGWPGSVIEFAKMIGPLNDPEAHGGEHGDAFHVVCPALPRFGFSGKPGHPENALSREEPLDNLMIYWLPDAAASSARLCWESFTTVSTDPVALPTGISMFPREVGRTSRRRAEGRFSDLRFFSEPGKDGHFAAFEQPGLFVADVRAFSRTVRSTGNPVTTRALRENSPADLTTSGGV